MKAEEYISKNELLSENDNTIVGILWYDSEISTTEKLNLSFEFFDRSPSYSILSELNMVYKELNAELKVQLWSKYKKYLKNGTDAQKKQIKYSLWVDFFEDQETVYESWNELIGNCDDEHLLREILTISGPVPFEMKDKLYQKMIKNRINHKSILESLVGSLFDVYGKINFSRARLILPTLKVDNLSKQYLELNKKLNEFNSKDDYWNSLRK